MKQIKNLNDELELIKEQNNDLMKKITSQVIKNRLNADISSNNLQNNKILEDTFKVNFRLHYDHKQKPRKFNVIGDQLQIKKEQNYVSKIKAITDSLNVYNIEVKDLEKRLKEKHTILKKLQ